MPYEPIPYAPDEVYSNRDYTRQQMALLQQQADREGAYAQRRGALMADRWKGLGGLATETLASLVQSRDLRDAKAEAQRRSDVEQARYGTEQARLDRAESDRTRAFEAATARDLREDDWRRRQEEKAEELRQLQQILDQDPDRPLSEAQRRLYEKYNPTSLRDRQPSPATTPAPPRDIGDAAIGPVTFSPQAPPRVGADVFGKVTFGGPPQTLAGVSRRQPLFPSTPPPPAQGPTEFRRPRTSAEARAEQALVLAQTRRDEDVAYRKEQDAIEAATRAQAQRNFETTNARLGAAQGLARSDQAKALPSGVQSYIASLASGGIRNGVTYPARGYGEAKAEVLRAWKALSKDHKGIDLPTVLATLDKLYGFTVDPETGDRTRWSAVVTGDEQ